jgi:hypothetical protein
VFRDLCTTPCSVSFTPGSYDLRTTGTGIASGIHTYRVDSHPVRFHLRVRPGWGAALGGASIAVAVLATLASVGLLANASINHADPLPGWLVLGGGAVFGVTGAGLEIWTQSTGVSRVERLPETQ